MRSHYYFIYKQLHSTHIHILYLFYLILFKIIRKIKQWNNKLPWNIDSSLRETYFWQGKYWKAECHISHQVHFFTSKFALYLGNSLINVILRSMKPHPLPIYIDGSKTTKSGIFLIFLYWKENKFTTYIWRIIDCQFYIFA